jgi:DNA-binding winged helix-turn-helix (wHTH) protein
MVQEKDGIYKHGKFKLDHNQREVWVGDELKNLQEKQYEVLLYLVKNSNRVVEKEELFNSVWGDVIVQEHRLNRIATELRSILGGTEAIKNKAKVGYKFNPDFFLDQIPCPWRGFRFYDEANKDFFCGREEDVNKIINKLQTNPFFLTLTGPSGVGKTSLVKAGLIPKLKREGISSRWKFLSLRPTHRPLFELARKIASIKHPGSSLTDEIIDPIIENLRIDHKSIIQELNETTELKLFLFVDQIETLLSKEITDSEADIFAEFLLELSEIKQVTQAIVLGLRRDFYDEFCKRFNKLLVLITENLVPIEELSETQLKRVIDEPARLSGLDIEEGVSDQIVEELLIEKNNERRDSPLGILPLLSNFLVELFGYREGNLITFRSYFSSGKIENSISRYAEEVFEDLSNKPLAEKLLILLVNVGESPSNDSCKPVTVSEILGQFEEKDKEEVQIIIQELIEKRLLISWNDPQKNVELPHASLIKNWTKIQSLLSNKRRAIRFAETLKRKTGIWLERDKDPDELMKGSELQTAIELHEQYISLIGVGQKEEKFFNASVSAKSDREKRELQEKKRKARYKNTIWGLSGIIGVVFIGLIYFLWVNNKANAAKTAADALTELDKNPAKALKLAIQAVEMDETPDTVAVLQAAITSSRLWKSLKGHIATLTAIAISNDGKFLITSSRDNTARIWDRESGQLIHILTGHEKAVECATFSPDGKYALTSSSDGTARVWEVSSGKEIKKIESRQKGVNNVAILMKRSREANCFFI